MGIPHHANRHKAHTLHFFLVRLLHTHHLNADFLAHRIHQQRGILKRYMRLPLLNLADAALWQANTLTQFLLSKTFGLSHLLDSCTQHTAILLCLELILHKL